MARSTSSLGRLVARVAAGTGAASALCWAAAVGLLAGLVGGVFRLGVGRVDAVFALARDSAPAFLSVALAGACAGVAFVLVRRFAPEAAGSGIQEIEGALEGRRTIRSARVLAVKFVGGLLALGAGLVMGREGPTVQMGGAVGQMLRERLRLPTALGNTLVCTGAGAGLTAAFNAPLAGILFVLEEMRPQFRYDTTSVQCVVVGCALSDVVVRALVGDAVAVPIGAFPMPALPGLLSVALLGVCLGFVGWVFNATLLGSVSAAGRLAPGARVAFALSVGAGIGVLAYSWHDATGGGYRAIHDALAAVHPASGLLALFAVRFALTITCFSSGVPGGIFAPLVALGTIFGVWFADALPAWARLADVDPGVFVVAGMGALFAATVRAPLTGIVLAAEVTGNFGLILPVTIACASATLVAQALGGRPIYTALLDLADRTAARRRAS